MGTFSFSTLTRRLSIGWAEMNSCNHTPPQDTFTRQTGVGCPCCCCIAAGRRGVGLEGCHLSTSHQLWEAFTWAGINKQKCPLQEEARIWNLSCVMSICGTCYIVQKCRYLNYIFLSCVIVSSGVYPTSYCAPSVLTVHNGIWTQSGSGLLFSQDVVV